MPNKRFTATRGGRTTVFWAKDRTDALDWFEGCYSLENKDIAWSYQITQKANRSDAITCFLIEAGRGVGETKQKENMSDEKLSNEVRKYMSNLGKKGGKANPAGTKKRRKQAREAAAKRWEKYRKEQKNKEEEK